MFMDLKVCVQQKVFCSKRSQPHCFCFLLLKQPILKWKKFTLFLHFFYIVFTFTLFLHLHFTLFLFASQATNLEMEKFYIARCVSEIYLSQRKFSWILHLYDNAAYEKDKWDIFSQFSRNINLPSSLCSPTNRVQLWLAKNWKELCVRPWVREKNTF